MKQSLSFQKVHTSFKNSWAISLGIAVGLLIGVVSSDVAYADATSTAPEVPQLCQATSTIVVSDTTNTVDGSGNAVAAWVPPMTWINTLIGSTWIWSAENVVDPTVDETHTFEKTFSLAGTTTDASMQIASDDTYKVFVNGTEIPGDSDPNGFNWGALDTLTIDPALFVVGQNKIGVEVKNLSFEGAIPESNPAGVLYRLSVTGNICAPVPPVTPTSTDATSTDVCPNIAGDQEAVPDGKHIVDGQCVNIVVPVVAPAQGGGTVHRGGGGSGGHPTLVQQPTPTGLVLGASTSTGESVAPECSTEYLSDHLRIGAKNNPDQVMKLQTFLNKHMGTNMPVTGFFGSMTLDAVKKFQVENADQILTPWVPYGLKDGKTPTGYVYKTTRRWINLLECQNLDTAMPVLP